PDHIPRPRNAFLIFRGKISKKVEGDHRHISIAAAEVWKAFTEDEKQPYLVKAELEKLEHRRLYPSYRFTP
ncbi:high mobility group box domain-containing protein, partial [Mycena leptocephala]